MGDRLFTRLLFLCLFFLAFFFRLSSALGNTIKDYGNAMADTSVLEIKASSITKLDGSTDNSRALQKLLDKYAGFPVHLIIDGNALGFLRLHSETHISIPAGFTWTVPKGSNKAAFETFDKSRTSITTKNIIIDGGGTIECNGSTMARYKSANGTSPTGFLEGFYTDGNHEFVVGMRLYNIDHLEIHNLKLFHAASFSVHLFRDSNILIDSLYCDAGPVPVLGTDMIHCNGYVQNAVFKNLTSRVYDDVIGLNADDGSNKGAIEDENILGPYVTSGPITNVLVSNVYCLPGSMQAFRLLSKHALVDQITLENFTGSVSNYLGNISGYVDSVPGNFGIILIQHFDLKITERQALGDTNPVLLEIRDNIKSLTISHLKVIPIDSRDLISINTSADIGEFHLENMEVIDTIPAAENAKIIRLKGKIRNAVFKSVSWRKNAGGTNYLISGSGYIEQFTTEHIILPEASHMTKDVHIGNHISRD